MTYLLFVHTCFQFTCNYSKECVQPFDVSVSVDSTGNITTDLFAKPTVTHIYLLGSFLHDRIKRSMPYNQGLRILRILSNIETTRLRCSELVNCLVKCGYVQ